jgi:hypothetical protein
VTYELTGPDPVSRQREQLPVPGMQVDPVLAPFLAVGGPHARIPDRGMTGPTPLRERAGHYCDDAQAALAGAELA